MERSCMARWLSRVVIRIHELAGNRRIRLTAKATAELSRLELDPDDARDVLMRLSPSDSTGREISEATGEWLYKFKPLVGRELVYVKLIIRVIAWWCRSMKTRVTNKMTRSSRKTSSRRRGVALPDDACPACATPMKPVRGRLGLTINGESLTVPSVAHLKCSSCGEVVLRFQDAKRLHEDAVAIYRRKHGLLSGDEIRALRKQFDLTQADLARLLRLGGNTVSRWESGRNVQTGAMDMLLRIIRDLPGGIDYLRGQPA
jgi:putative zinc finger/helix-turn-helix YgiT family protein